MALPARLPSRSALSTGRSCDGRAYLQGRFDRRQLGAWLRRRRQRRTGAPIEPPSNLRAVHDRAHGHPGRRASGAEAGGQAHLIEWAEANFVLASGSSARPGRFQLWGFQKEILDVIGDPVIERVIVQKSTRVGFTKSLVAAIGASAATDPCSVILLLPTDDDCRGISTDEIEPAFEQSPALHGLLGIGRASGRNTLTVKTARRRRFSLKILAAEHRAIFAATMLRSCSLTRPMAWKSRAKVTRSRWPSSARSRTPTGRSSSAARRRTRRRSVIHRLYQESDQRVFEMPCVHCGAYFEVEWEHLVWPADDPTDVSLRMSALRRADRRDQQDRDGCRWPLACDAAARDRLCGLSGSAH